MPFLAEALHKIEEGRKMPLIDKLILAVILSAIVLVFVGTRAWMPGEERGQVFVLREYMCESDKGPAKVIEYFVNGLPSVVVFYDGDAEKLEAFRKYLRRVGQ